MSRKSHRKKQATPERLMEMSSAYGPPLVIGAAVGNKVFDSLESGPKSAEQVSKETGASEHGLRIIMNALVGLELLKKDRQKKYSLTPESAAFLVSGKPGTLAGFFGTNSVVVQHSGGAEQVYVDVNHNGAFDPASDLVTHLDSISASLTGTDFLF